MGSDVEGERRKNPRINANILEVITFSWIIDLFKIGQSRDVESKDVYAILDDHASSKLVNELEKKWTGELSNAHKSNREPSFFKALNNTFGVNYMSFGFFISLDELVLKISQPLFIGELLRYFDASESADKRHAYICASGLVISMLISTFLIRSAYNAISRCAMKVRVACSSILFRKALKLSHKALGQTTAGQVINLLTNDLNRFDMELLYPQYIWIGLLQTIIITYFLWREIGISSFCGIAILLFVIPLQGWLGKKTFEFRLKTAKLTDNRGRLINEIIASIQVIKMYTWEKPFSKLIEHARRKEIGQIKRITRIHAFSFLYRGILIRFQMFACILSYVLLGNNISTQKVFVIISFYSLLQTTMTVFFCTGIAQVADLLATIKRIQNFLLLEEKYSTANNALATRPDVSTNGTKNCNGNLKEVGIEISNATATWDEHGNSNTLNGISLKVRPGQLAAIIGPVGAGKSSIIQLILRELPLSEGQVSVRGEVSYASQEPWLFTGSVQKNILFDSPMNDERYKQVVRACGLERDFEQFTHGDKTIVGEKGVTLSGGQKSRINLARAIYKQADIYLLDDPLSAVDSRVGKHLYEQCIKGYLKNKTCILTTHQVQLLRNEELIVFIEKSTIAARGSYQEIIASGVDFDGHHGFTEESNVESDITGKTNSRVNNISNERAEPPVGKSVRNEDKGEPNEVGESRRSGRIPKRVYVSYLSAFGSSFLVFLFFFTYIITQVLISSVDFWITFWVNQEDYVFRNENDSVSNSSLGFRQTSIIVFVALNVLLIVSISLRSAIFVRVCTKASLNLHRTLFTAVLRAKMFFFHSNSSGRILNRFSNDMGTIDERLPFMLLELFQMVSRVLGIVVITVLIKVYFLIPTIFVGVLVYHMRSYYLFTARSVKRLEGVARSPVLAHMNASLQGLSTIRANKAEKTMSNQFDSHLDFHSSVWYLLVCSNDAFGLWVDVVCVIYISVIIFSLLFFSDYTVGGYVGLVITQIMGLIGVLQYLAIQSAMIDNQMISVERVHEYANCPQEDDNQRHSGDTQLKGWPNLGRIEFKNFNLRYSINTPYVLKNLNFQIRSKEKIGIVGRTGAGKSSIIQALFRLAFGEGEIVIDDVEIHKLELNELRSKMSVIPQEPVLYSGRMRYNLDPFDEFSDHVLWNALEEVQLKAHVENLPGGLNTEISESGSNFSVGQKQLICLARTLLRRNKILILDEATANIDAQTDALIQNTIKKNFHASTVITVAHRLNTIMDSDRVLVMDVGSVIEFDHPHVLLKNKNGLFYSMVEQSGRATADLIHRVAAENFQATLKIN